MGTPMVMGAWVWSTIHASHQDGGGGAGGGDGFRC
jgi:hypothetical protein